MYCQPLDGEWSLRKANSEESFPARVPGNVHVDLMAAGVIPDAALNDNELKVAWVAENDWTYTRTFTADAQILSAERILLECDGLDTICTIRLNGKEIACTDNMHRRYEFDVTSYLTNGMNTLEIEFASPVKYALAHISDESMVITPGDSIPGSPCVRKAMYQWGWDWAPKIPTSGIWRSIRLAGYSAAKIEDIHIRQHHDSHVVNVEVEASVIRYSDRGLSLQAILTSPNGDTLQESVELEDGESKAKIVFSVRHPLLWWPNGYGDQPLYEIQVSLIEPDNPAPCDTEKKRIGLRTLELRQDPDEWGKSFVFVVNGVPIFCKGANWVPADQFPARISQDQYRDLIQSAATVHMNMLRVWGGGIYEDEIFYDLCDEHGILIWQDFMFAGAHYPHNEEFLQNIRLEVVDNIRRIRHRPCLALWCGNNEMEWFLARGWEKTGDEERKREYADLFYHLIPELVSAEDPDTPYWSSSPASGVPFDDPNDELSGDGHYWEVWHGRALFTAYRQHYFRFMSEFGFQSLPSMTTVASFADRKDWNIVSYIMEVHQKSYVGNGHIVNDLMQVFRLPSSFPMLVYASQVLQAEAIRYGVEHWRRNRNGNRCMGTLYWQLNDCWPVSSWSSIEYNHTWKGLHYAAKRFYAPVLLSAEESPNAVKLHITNDGLKPFRGKIRWSLERLNGVKIVDGEINVEVPAQTNVCIADLDFADKLDESSRRDTILAYGLMKKNRRLSIGMATFVPSKYLELLDPSIAQDVEERDGQIEVLLAAHNAARFVMLEVPGYNVRFSDNFIDLPAGRLVTVNVEDPAGLTCEEISTRLKVISLWDSY